MRSGGWKLPARAPDGQQVSHLEDREDHKLEEGGRRKGVEQGLHDDACTPGVPLSSSAYFIPHECDAGRRPVGPCQTDRHTKITQNGRCGLATIFSAAVGCSIQDTCLYGMSGEPDRRLAVQGFKPECTSTGKEGSSGLVADCRRLPGPLPAWRSLARNGCIKVLAMPSPLEHSTRSRRGIISKWWGHVRPYSGAAGRGRHWIQVGIKSMHWRTATCSLGMLRLHPSSVAGDCQRMPIMTKFVSLDSRVSCEVLSAGARRIWGLPPFPGSYLW